MEAITIRRNEHLPPVDLTLHRARSGDLAAFEELYRLHVRRVYALCLRMTADPSRAEESTQETFVRAWRQMESFRGDGEFAAWLRRVAINVVLSARRADKRRAESGIDDLGEHRAPVTAPGTAAGIDLEAAIARLPAGARTVFVLHDIEGYRHDEIARMTGLATGTSKSQLHRARKLIREAWKQ